MWLLAGRCVLGLEDLPSDRGTGLLGLGPDQHPRPLAPASVASSAVMSTAIMATLLLFKHQKVGPGVLRAPGRSHGPWLSAPLPTQGVFLSQLLGEFSWLTEETLLRGFDVGFSGQLRCLVQHTLGLLRPHVALLRIQQGDLLVVPRPGPGLTSLARLSAELLPTFLSEAVGGESPGLAVGGTCRGEGRGAPPHVHRLLPQPVLCEGCWQARCRPRAPGSCRASSC